LKKQNQGAFVGKKLKAYYIVAHVINLESTQKKTITSKGEKFRILAVYINRYGMEIGMLVESSEGRLISYDRDLFKEYESMPS
jgi:hypothetical protein